MMGIGWLTRDLKPGKLASLLVIDMLSAVVIGRMKMGRRLFHNRIWLGWW